MYNPTITVTVEVNNLTYIARLDTDSDEVTILRRDGGEGEPLIQSGRGRWDGESVVDCPANLGDEAWEAIDEALAEAIIDAE